MKGAIIINGYYESEAYAHQVVRIVEEFKMRNISLEVIKNNKGFSSMKKFPYDYVIFLDKDVYLARMLEQAGEVVFNNSFAIENCDDKIKTAISLKNCDDIYMPKSFYAPLKYHKNGEYKEFLDRVEKEIGYPLVVKKAVGSLGEGIKLINNREELEQAELEYELVPHLYQVYVEESKGQSARAFVIGNKVVASMLLTNVSDFRSNVEHSKAESVELDENYVNAAEKISECLELDYCAVDFFVGAALVIEVNSNAYFKKIEEVTDVNIAGAYADYILDFLVEINGKWTNL